MERADQALVDRGLAPSRSAAQRLISAGAVTLTRSGFPASVVGKSATKVGDDDVLAITDRDEILYASRGGLKLAGAIARIGLDVHGLCAIDVGQSTGGFTDYLLEAGVTSVVGIDVGHDQLIARLRGDPRVVVFEGINARALEADELREQLEDAGRAQMMPDDGFDLAVVDVSFISLTLVMPAVRALLCEGAALVALVKPQFEVGRDGVDSNGLVRDPADYDRIEPKIRGVLGGMGFDSIQWFDSPIAGTDGNREFFVCARASRRSRDEPAAGDAGTMAS